MVKKQEKVGELIRFPVDWSVIAVISEIRAEIKKVQFCAKTQFSFIAFSMSELSFISFDRRE